MRVMSLHKSKGLTSKVVIVAECIEGLVPTLDEDHTPDEAAANLEEQRRLFYVAITRCREIMVLSSVIQLEKVLPTKLVRRCVAVDSWEIQSQAVLLTNWALMHRAHKTVHSG